MDITHTAVPQLVVKAPGVTQLWEAKAPFYRDGDTYYRGVVQGCFGGQTPVAACQHTDGSIAFLPTGWSDNDQIWWALEHDGLSKLIEVEPSKIFGKSQSWTIPYSKQEQGEVRLSVIPTAIVGKQQKLFVFSEAFWGSRYRLMRVSWMVGKFIQDQQGLNCYYREMCEVASYLHGELAPWIWGSSRERYKQFCEIYCM